MRPLFWLENGWPVVAPLPYHGQLEQLDSLTAEEQADWEVIVFAGPAIQTSQIVTDLPTYLTTINSSHVFFRDKLGTYVSGMSTKGIAFFGKKV